jgi:hypothetical protein
MVVQYKTEAAVILLPGDFKSSAAIIEHEGEKDAASIRRLHEISLSVNCFFNERKTRALQTFYTTFYQF